MPYIKQEERPQYDKAINEIVDKLTGLSEKQLCGHLNYIIFTIVKRLVGFRKPSYFLFNTILGAINCCSREIYRRLVGPYEDIKASENGDV